MCSRIVGNWNAHPPGGAAGLQQGHAVREYQGIIFLFLFASSVSCVVVDERGSSMA
jgi:hypothetical protein